MRNSFILLAAAVGMAGCSGGGGANNAESSAPDANASAAAPAAACDMAEPGGDRQQPSNGDVALIRQVVAWQAIMVDKARVCAEGAGFTDLSRMVERPIGSHVRDEAGQYSRRTEGVWAARGMRDGAAMEVFVTNGGVVSWAPSPPGATGVVDSLEPSRRAR